MKRSKKRFLVCGDLHTKYDIFLRAINKFETEKFDKIIFLGDYCDDWNASPESSRELLEHLIEFKNKYPNKCILLLGNHDLSEWFGGDFKCSGYNSITHLICKDLFDKNENLFQIAYPYKNWLFTHAGVHNSWLKDISLLDEEFKEMKYPYRISAELNLSLSERNNNIKYNRLFKALNSVGGYRGGFSSPSPVWTDYKELISNPAQHINQVVGHTPVKTIVSHTIKRENKKDILYFCDTHSTYTNGENIGDNSFLELEI